MTDGDSLRAAVVANPDDDLPRLIFADWLDENDQTDRAAFIRAQIEAARCEPFSPGARHAEERALKLLIRNRTEWTRPLGYAVEAAFVRGFVERISLQAPAFSPIAPDIFLREPVRELSLTRALSLDERLLSPLEPIFESDLFERVTRLELPFTNLTPEECYSLTVSPHMEQLRELSLRGNPLSPDWVSDLIAGRYFSNLTALDLSQIAHIGTSILRGLTKEKRSRFKSLDFSDVMFQSNILIQILSCRAVSRVEELRLRWTGGSRVAGPLTHLDIGWVFPWKALRLLDVSGQGLGATGAREIAQNLDAEKLRWLGLAENDLSSEGASALIASPYLCLYYLDVRRNGLNARDVNALITRFPDALVLA